MITNKELLASLSKSLHFELSENELSALFNEFNSLINDFGAINKLNVEHLEPTHFCVKQSYSSLREDVPVATKNPEEIIKNAPNKRDGYIVVK
jgi:aspartyl/glutamyl-tRNA(Asn/Gln) amidotransferase C subunit